MTDKKRIASGSYDNTIKIWNIKTQQYKTNFENCSVSCLLEFDSQRIISGCLDGRLKVWNTKNEQCSLYLHGHTSTLTCITKLDNERVVTTLQGHVECISCVIQLNEKVFASGSIDKTIRIWNLETNTCVKTIKNDSYVRSIILMSEESIVRIEIFIKA